MATASFQNAPNYQTIYSVKSENFFTKLINNNPKFFGVLIVALILLLVSIFSESEKKPEKTTFEKRQEQLKRIYQNPEYVLVINKKIYNTTIKMAWHDDISMPSWEDLSLYSTQQLLILYERVEATGNRILVDMIREVLLARSVADKTFDFRRVIPPGVYTMVVVRTETGWGVSFVETQEIFRQVVGTPWYAGATDVYIRGDGFFEMQGTTFFVSKMLGVTRKIIEDLVREMLEDLGYKEANPIQVPEERWIGPIPELPAFTRN